MHTVRGDVGGPGELEPRRALWRIRWRARYGARRVQPDHRRHGVARHGATLQRGCQLADGCGRRRARADSRWARVQRRSRSGGGACGRAEGGRAAALARAAGVEAAGAGADRHGPAQQGARWLSAMPCLGCTACVCCTVLRDSTVGFSRLEFLHVAYRPCAAVGSRRP